VGVDIVFLKLRGSVEAGVQFLRSKGGIFGVYRAVKVIDRRKKEEIRQF
jgi:hypothetical protein